MGASGSAGLEEMTPEEAVKEFESAYEQFFKAESDDDISTTHVRLSKAEEAILKLAKNRRLSVSIIVEALNGFEDALDRYLETPKRKQRKKLLEKRRILLALLQGNQTHLGSGLEEPMSRREALVGMGRGLVAVFAGAGMVYDGLVRQGTATVATAETIPHLNVGEGAGKTVEVDLVAIDRLQLNESDISTSLPQIFVEKGAFVPKALRGSPNLVELSSEAREEMKKQLIQAAKPGAMVLLIPSEDGSIDPDWDRFLKNQQLKGLQIPPAHWERMDTLSLPELAAFLMNLPAPDGLFILHAIEESTDGNSLYLWL